MTTVYDAIPDHLIRKVAEELRKRKEITPPDWAAFAKTGAHKEMPPEDPDWWYVRVAAVLRRVYVDGPLGVERMRSWFKSREDRKETGSQESRRQEAGKSRSTEVR